MSDKVKLPREVANAIEYYSGPGLDYSKYGIFDNILGAVDEIAVKARRSLIFRYSEGPCWDVLMQALVNGYEVEQTPEDKLKEYYKDQAGKTVGLQDSTHYAIKHTLELLNIKIEGVNA